MDRLIAFYFAVTEQLERFGAYLGLLGIRLILGWEFYSAGMMKYRGQNWFARIQDDFPFPFNVLPTSLSWQLALWAEVIGGIALVLGLGTRFVTATLMVVTFVAAYAVHFPDQWTGLADFLKGYVITNKGFGNYRLPLIFLVMFVPLGFFGAGKLSLDHLIRKYFANRI
ncbi:MAG: DoxX family protein [Pseudomonadota bacterium]|nr:DoxX family protein [Pseudomonadota bacterium]